MDEQPTAEGIQTLTYEPSATIVVNAAENRWDDVKPEQVTAYRLSDELRMGKNHAKYIVDNNKRIDELTEYLRENYEEMGDHAEAIARIFDIELERSITVTVTVEFEVQATVPIGVDVQEELTWNGVDASFDSFGGNIEMVDWAISDTKYDWDYTD